MESLIAYNRAAAGIHSLSCIGQFIFLMKFKTEWQYPVTIDEYEDLTVSQIREIKEIRAENGNSSSGRKNINNIVRNLEKERVLFKVPLGWSQLLFSIICVLAHLYLLSGSGENGFYSKWMDQGVNPMRWLEYFFSSAIMMTNIAGLSGIRNLYMILSVFALTAVTNIFGLISEEAAAQGNKFRALFYFFLGFIPFIIPWVYIIQRFNSFEKWFEENIVKKTNRENGIPSFVRIVIWSLLGSYMIFPMIQLFQIIMGKKYYIAGEKGFLIASIISKTLLTWAVFGGAFREDNSDEYLNQGTNANEDDDTWVLSLIIALIGLFFSLSFLVLETYK